MLPNHINLNGYLFCLYYQQVMKKTLADTAYHSTLFLSMKSMVQYLQLIQSFTGIKNLSKLK